jgi:hypothetical protein
VYRQISLSFSKAGEERKAEDNSREEPGIKYRRNKVLILRAFVNDKQIDEIFIQNKGGNMRGLCTYEVVKPSLDGTIKHNRPDGWVPLAATVLSALAEAGYQTDEIKRGGIQKTLKAAKKEE